MSEHAAAISPAPSNPGPSSAARAARPSRRGAREAPAPRRSLTGAVWVLRGADRERVEHLRRRLRLHPALARCLVLREAAEEAQARAFLAPSLDDLLDPYLMHGMATAVERLRRAARDKERVRVVTDYDVDGTTSSLILQSTLELLGDVDVSYHIPHRMTEGYGFSVEAAEEAARDGVDLIVTADIGVKDHDAVQRARALGVDVLILDHHLPPGSDVPGEALAVLCPPQKACRYPNKDLAACGVSLKLAQALLADHPAYERILTSLLKLAAIGTVADVVSLLGAENRAIVTLGLRALNAGPHNAGLRALLEVADVSPGAIEASDLGFRVGPRINAAGRIASASSVVELLTCRDPARAQRLARALDALNSERRKIQERMQRLAIEQVPSPVPAFIVVWGPEAEGWHRGVVGIVASRLRERFNRPTAVVGVGDTRATGSVRSIDQIHAVEALDAASDLLDRHGGHPMAAGFSLDPARLPDLAARLAEVTWTMLGEQAPELRRDVDLLVDAHHLGWPLLDALTQLAPHGKGNPTPRLCVRGGQLSDLRLLKERHLKARLRASASGPPIDVIWWSAAQHLDALREADEVELLGRLEVNVWRGNRSLQLILDDARLR